MTDVADKDAVAASVAEQTSTTSAPAVKFAVAEHVDKPDVVSTGAEATLDDAVRDADGWVMSSAAADKPPTAAKAVPG